MVVSELRAWRMKQGLSLSQAAKLFQMSPARLSEIETGASCTLRAAVRIEDVTGGLVTPRHIFRDHIRAQKRIADRALRERKRTEAAASRQAAE